MLKKILLGIAAILVLFLLIVAAQPARYSITRGATITAPPEVVFAEVNDFRRWEAWSPWKKLDPEMKQTFEGAEAGVGAIYSWAGNKDVGEGRMTIVASRTNELVVIKLEFFKPMAGVCATEFTFAPQGEQTTVTWTMTGTNNFISKAFCLFMDMDEMVGGDFEEGLTGIKSIAEAAERQP